MAEEQAKRKLAVILSADVKGYSCLMADDEEATVRTITAYREVMTSLTGEHRGRVADAVRCAVEVQKELKERNSGLPEHRRMEFRIGIKLGDVIEEEGTIYGDGGGLIEGSTEGQYPVGVYRYRQHPNQVSPWHSHPAANFPMSKRDPDSHIGLFC